MNLVQRVQDILLKPKQTWPVIEAEPADAGSLYKGYLMPLALIPALASFIGLSLIGVGAFGVHVRIPIVSGLVSLLLGYVLTLVMTFVLALIVDALAPTFGGTRNRVAALKLVVYASTAALVGGIFSLLPMLSVLGLLAALYSLYLLYTGLPVLMKCPQDKAVGYTAVVAICGIVAAVVIGSLSALFTPSHAVLGAAGSVSLNTPGGQVSIDTSKMQEAARRMEDAGKRLEQAQASGDSAAVSKATGDMMAALTGGGGTVIPSDQLRALLPETAGGLPRESIEAQSGGAMGLGGSTARATYRNGDQRIELAVTDAGAAGALATAWSQITLDRETADGVEKVYKDGKRTVREDYRKDKSHGEYLLILDNGLLVEGKGDNLDIDAVRSAVKSLDLGRAEGLKRPQKS
ncbi:Yip1 family protein [Xylophilus sp. GW821-FHT01B05]